MRTLSELDKMFGCTSLADDIRRNPKEFVERIQGEREILEFGNSVNWDRTAVIDWLCNPATNPKSAWLGRETFERSYDSGKMRQMAETYDTVGRECGV